MKSIFLKNGISLFGALLLSQASFCSDRSIDPEIDQFINGVRSKATKRKHSEINSYYSENGSDKKQLNISAKICERVDSIAESWNLDPLKDDVDINEASKSITPDDIKQLKELLELVSEVNLKEKIKNGLTPCCYILDKFIDNNAEHTVKNNGGEDAIATTHYHGEKYNYRKKNLLKFVNYVLKNDLDKEKLKGIVDKLKFSDSYSQQEIQTIRFQYIAGILCIMFQRYFNTYPKDRCCVDVQKSIWRTILKFHYSSDPQGFYITLKPSEYTQELEYDPSATEIEMKKNKVVLYYDVPRNFIKEGSELFRDVRNTIKQAKAIRKGANVAK